MCGLLKFWMISWHGYLKTLRQNPKHQTQIEFMLLLWYTMQEIWESQMGQMFLVSRSSWQVKEDLSSYGLFGVCCCISLCCIHNRSS